MIYRFYLFEALEGEPRTWCSPLVDTKEASQVNFLHLVGLGGSNKVMAGELSRLARRAFAGERSRELLRKQPQKSGPGGLLYPFAHDLAALAVNYHRTSARVLWDLYQSHEVRLEPLYEKLLTAVEEDDRDWMKDGLSFSVLPFGVRHVEAGERQIVGVVKNALIDGAHKKGITLRLDPEKPDLTFHVRGNVGDQGAALIRVSIDLAGRPMHQRGYRMVSGEAPLREDLAANLVMLGRFDAKKDVLIDPMAGAGTLAVEAALMAAGKPVWMSGRKADACKIDSMFDSLASLNGPLFADSLPKIYACENDETTYDALDRSLATAGTGPQTTTFLGDFQKWDLAQKLKGQEQGLILCNPPYGARLGGGANELRQLYRDLGRWCRDFHGFRAGFIVGEPESDRELRSGPSIIRLFIDSFGGEPRVKKPVNNGPLRAQFLLYDL